MNWLLVHITVLKPHSIYPASLLSEFPDLSALICSKHIIGTTWNLGPPLKSILLRSGMWFKTLYIARHDGPHLLSGHSRGRSGRSQKQDDLELGLRESSLAWHPARLQGQPEQRKRLSLKLRKASPLKKKITRRPHFENHAYPEGKVTGAGYKTKPGLLIPFSLSGFTPW